MHKAIFFDRDGVIIEERNYISKPEDVKLSDGAAEALQKAKAAGYMNILVSNQSGIARGYFTPDDLANVEKRMLELLRQKNAVLDACYYCFHHPKGCVERYSKVCDCRKPAPGMLLKAMEEHDIDPMQSFMIGDKMDDIRAGENAKCRFNVLVRTGHGMEQTETLPDGSAEVANVLSAVNLILKQFS